MPNITREERLKRNERKDALEKLSNKDWRLNFLYSCKSKDGGEKLNFKPNKSQIRLFDALKEHRRVIILKARQLGITTGCITWSLDETLFHRNVNALTIMQTKDDSINAFEEKAHFSWRGLEEGLKSEMGWSVSTERANQLTFGFGKDATSTYAVSNSGRSGTFQIAHISELAYVDAHWPQSSKEIVTGTIPAVPQSGTVIIESTANGEEGNFANIWREAVAGKNGYFPLFFSWREVSATGSSICRSRCTLRIRTRMRRSPIRRAGFLSMTGILVWGAISRCCLG